MQMARTTIAVKKLKKKKLPYVVILTNPTTGGVTASFAMLGDVFISAELKGYICYLLYPYTLGKEVSQRLRGGRKERWCKLPYHSSIFPGCGPGTYISQLQLHHCFPTIPFCSWQEEQSCYFRFQLGLFSWHGHTIPVHPSQKFGGFFAFSHSSLISSLSDLPHVHHFICT